MHKIMTGATVWKNKQWRGRRWGSTDGCSLCIRSQWRWGNWTSDFGYNAFYSQLTLCMCNLHVSALALSHNGNVMPSWTKSWCHCGHRSVGQIYEWYTQGIYRTIQWIHLLTPDLTKIRKKVFIWCNTFVNRITAVQVGKRQNTMWTEVYHRHATHFRKGKEKGKPPKYSEEDVSHFLNPSCICLRLFPFVSGTNLCVMAMPIPQKVANSQ